MSAAAMGSIRPIRLSRRVRAGRPSSRGQVQYAERPVNPATPADARSPPATPFLRGPSTRRPIEPSAGEGSDPQPGAPQSRAAVPLFDARPGRRARRRLRIFTRTRPAKSALARFWSSLITSIIAKGRRTYL